MGYPRNTHDYTTPEASLPSTTSSSPSDAHAPPPPRTKKRSLSVLEVPRNIAWERRRQQERRKSAEDLTDEDLSELKGCIELGFGFDAEEGHRLCTTIPALDLYFAVNRQFLTSPLASPVGSGRTPPPPPPGSPAVSLQACGSFGDSDDSRKILGSGDDPQHVKTKLRHWAQAVACSVMQTPIRGAAII